MACFSPLDAWQTEGGDIVFVERGNILRSLILPCGQCVGCRLERSRQWAMRCLHESQMHENSCFITLTYSEDNLPYRGSLEYRHFQLFMKRLRRKLGIPVRFYMCGEYGDTYGRPHFHACLFGCFFDDRVPFSKSGSGSVVYTSELLSSLWDRGFASVGDVTFESAAYVARYVMKKVTGSLAESHYERFCPITGEIYSLVPEFTHMSLKPGIGFSWFEKFKCEVYGRSVDDVDTADYVIVNGQKVRPPKYYDRLLTVMDPMSKDWLDFSRYTKAQSFGDDYTVDRLRAREICAKARLSFLKRSVE